MAEAGQVQWQRLPISTCKMLVLIKEEGTRPLLGTVSTQAKNQAGMFCSKVGPTA